MGGERHRKIEAFCPRTQHNSRDPFNRNFGAETRKFTLFRSQAQAYTAIVRVAVALKVCLP